MVGAGDQGGGGFDDIAFDNLDNAEFVINHATGDVDYRFDISSTPTTGSVHLTNVEEVGASDGLGTKDHEDLDVASGFSYILAGSSSADELDLSNGSTLLSGSHTVSSSTARGALVFGKGGNDVIDGAGTLSGEEGDDELKGGADTDTMSVNSTSISTVDLSNVTVTNVETLDGRGGSTSGVHLIADAADLFSVTSIIGDDSNDRITLNNSADISAITFTGIDVTGTQTSSDDDDIVAATSGSLNLVGTTLSNIATITMTQASAVQILTTDAANIAGINVTGTDSDEIITTTGDLSLAGSTLSNVATITFDTGGGGAATLTATGATLNGADITGTSDDVITDSGALDPTNSALSGIATITFDTAGSGVSTLTLSGATLNGADITGTSADLVTTTDSLDASNVVFTNISGLTFDSNNGGLETLTLTGATLNGGGGGQVVADGSLDLSKVTLVSGISQVKVDNNNDASSGTTDLIVNSSTVLNGAIINPGGTSTNHVHITSDDGLTLTGSTLFSLSNSGKTHSILIDSGGDTNGATLVANASTNFSAHGGITEIREQEGGSGSNDGIINSVDGLDLTNVQLIGIATVNFDSDGGTEANLIINSNTDLSTATINGNGDNDHIVVAAGGHTVSLANNTLTNLAIDGGRDDDNITGSSGADAIAGNGGGDVLNGGGSADTYEYFQTTDGSTTPGSGDTIATANFTASDSFQFDTSVFGDGGLTGGVSVTDILFNTNESTTLSDLTTTASTDQEGYFVELTGSTFNATLFDAIDTAIANGSAATGKGFVIADNGTDTKILYDPDFASASAGSLVELVTITGLADGVNVHDSMTVTTI